MIPLLYKSKVKALKLDEMECICRLTGCMSCKVEETRNGDYTIEATFSRADSSTDNLDTQLFIFAKPNPTDEPQFFEIYELKTKNKTEITAKGKHIKHCWYNTFIDCESLYTRGFGNPSELYEQVSNEHAVDYPIYFNFVSDVINREYISNGFCVPCTLGNFLMADSDSIVSLFDGEFKYNNFDVSFLKSRGIVRKYKIRWGDNVSSEEQTVSTENIVSAIRVGAKIKSIYENSPETNMASNIVEITGGTSKLNKLFYIDATNDETIKDLRVNDETQEGMTEARAALNALAQSYASKYALTRGKPSCNVKVTLRTELDSMKGLALCDTVQIVVSEDNIIDAKIIKTKYDTLLERWDSVELGQFKSKLSDFILATNI